MTDIEKAVTNFIHEIFEEQLPQVTLGKRFECNFTTGEIYFNLSELKEDLPQYILNNDFTRLNFHFTIENYFIFQLLHEAGHYFTKEKFSDLDNALDTLFKEQLSLEMRLLIKIKKEPSLEEIEDLNFRYWSLPMEYSATEWGINYYKQNEEKILKAWKKLRKTVYRMITFENIEPLMYFIGENLGSDLSFLLEN